MNKIIGALFLVFGIVIAVTASSATFAYFHADREVHLAVVADDIELIDLKPMQPYAYINSNGMLVVDLSTNNGNYPDEAGEGVSPDSLYVFEHVFGVSNHLWENTTICMEITYTEQGQQADAVSFFVGDYTGQIGSSSLTVTINPGETVPIGMIIDSTGLDEDNAIDGQLAFYATPGPCYEVD